MTRLNLLAPALLVIVFFGSGLPARAGTLQVTTPADGSIVVENDFTIVTLSPKDGGRIKSLIVKQTGDNLLYWNQKECLGGLLDDKNSTALPNDLKVLRQNQDVYQIQLTPPAFLSGVQLIKTLTFRADTSAIGLELRIENHGQQTSVQSSWMRNFIRPSGADISSADRYCMALSSGIVRDSAAALVTVPDAHGKMITKIAAPWQAFMSRGKSQGLAVVYLDDGYQAFYSWRESNVYPTYEWYTQPLPAGQTMATSLMIVPVSNLAGMSFANQNMAVNLPEEGQQPQKLQVMAVSAPLHALTFTVEDFDSTGQALGHPPDTALGDFETGKARDISFSEPAEAASAVMRRYTIHQGDQVLASFQDTIGSARGVSGTLPSPAIPARQVGPLPGWVAATPFAPVVTDADRSRGYCLYSREGDQAGHSLNELQFDLAPRLRESQFVVLDPQRNLGAVAVSLKPGPGASEAWLASNVLLRHEVAAPMPANTFGLVGHFYQLRPPLDMQVTKGIPENLWITIRGHDLQPGDYTFSLEINPTSAQLASLPIHVKVWNVHLPERQRISLEAEHVLPIMPGADYHDAPPTAHDAGFDERVRQVIDGYTKDMAEHGVNFAQLYGISPQASQVRIKATGETLASALKHNPDLLKKEPFPDLDLSGFDPWLVTAYKNGLTRFSTNAGTIVGRSFGSAEADRWFSAQLYQYVLSRGYQPQDVFTKVMDEVPTDLIPLMARNMGELKSVGWRTYSTYSTLFRYPELTRLVNPVSDMYQMAGWSSDEYLPRLEAGDIRPDAELWTYFGYATGWRSYQDMRSPGWVTAFCRLQGFHAHEYYRWKELAAAAIVSIENNQPIDSPAFEGLADGMSDGELLAELLARLDHGQNKSGHAVDPRDPSTLVLTPVVGQGEHPILPIRAIPGELGRNTFQLENAGDLAGTARYREARRAILALLAKE